MRDRRRRRRNGGLPDGLQAELVDGGKGGKDPKDDPKGPKNPDPGSGGSPDDENAFKILRDFFESLGIVFDQEIETLIKDAMVDGYGPDQLNLIMPDLEKTQAFRNRFVGYHQRVANGYNAISLGEYLQLENTYHRIMQEAGLPAGFYDDPSDFGGWIADNVSPDEIQNRVAMSVKAAQSVDPTARNLMARYYGLTTGDIASFFLDQDRALPVIERQYQAANVASWAARAGFQIDGITRYEDLVDSGITAEQAANSYGTIKSLNDTVGTIAGVYGETYDQSDAEADVFFGRNDKRRRLVSKETATFGGSSSGSTGSATRQTY